MLVGTNDLNEGGTYYQAKEFFVHSLFNQPLFANDIALILIDGSIKFSDKVKAIDYDSDRVPENVILQLSKPNKNTPSRKLKYFFI